MQIYRNYFMANYKSSALTVCAEFCTYFWGNFKLGTFKLTLVSIEARSYLANGS